MSTINVNMNSKRQTRKLKKGTYYVGDPCYILTDERYMKDYHCDGLNLPELVIQTGSDGMVYIDDPNGRTVGNSLMDTARTAFYRVGSIEEEDIANPTIDTFKGPMDAYTVLTFEEDVYITAYDGRYAVKGWISTDKTKQNALFLLN